MKLNDVIQAQASGDKLRKRDVVVNLLGSAKSSIASVAQQVYANEALQKTAARVTGAAASAGASAAPAFAHLKASIATAAGQVGELTAERRQKYTGWMMERMATPAAGAAAAVGFFLAQNADAQCRPYDIARKQERVEVVDIPARNMIKTSLVVKVGDTLNWTFGMYNARTHAHTHTHTHTHP